MYYDFGYRVGQKCPRCDGKVRYVEDIFNIYLICDQDESHLRAATPYEREEHARNKSFEMEKKRRLEREQAEQKKEAKAEAKRLRAEQRQGRKWYWLWRR